MIKYVNLSLFDMASRVKVECVKLSDSSEFSNIDFLHIVFNVLMNFRMIILTRLS